MAKLFWQSLTATPIIIAASLLTANGAMAQTATTEVNNSNSVDQTLETINNYQKEGRSNSMSQVTNVNQLRDVSPTDWAYEALRSLVDRYGCIAGFPNQTYRGSQPLSRYEFAAGLNSCLNQIERLIASSESVVREDLDTINRLTQEFEAELATLGGRIDNIESRTAFLED
ncbi:MAG: iron uptake porin, partial [Pleurocapsa sp.]